MELSIPGNSENEMVMYMFTNNLLSASYNPDRIYILTTLGCLHEAVKYLCKNLCVVHQEPVKPSKIKLVLI